MIKMMVVIGGLLRFSCERVGPLGSVQGILGQLLRWPTTSFIITVVIITTIMINAKYAEYAKYEKCAKYTKYEKYAEYAPNLQN